MKFEEKLIDFLECYKLVDLVGIEYIDDDFPTLKDSKNIILTMSILIMISNFLLLYFILLLF